MKISVIIPVLNEEGTIGKLVGYLKRCAGQHLIEEIIVVDGGSTDQTIREAEEAGAVVLKSTERSRARQMNEGGSAAQGEVLYFLHADSFPPMSFATDILITINEEFKAGCYRLRFDANHPFLRIYAWFTRFDVNLFRFGDQSLFITKDLFQYLGGFKKYLLIMEDQDMVIRIKRAGRFKIIQDYLTTSARKYLKNGVIKLQLVFTLLLTLHYIGFRQDKLIRVYKAFIK